MNKDEYTPLQIEDVYKMLQNKYFEDPHIGYIKISEVREIIDFIFKAKNEEMKLSRL